jgi:hypothetical protein
MAAPKSDKRKQDVAFQVRMTREDRQFLQVGADALSARSPSKVGLGPFLVWAAKRETERLIEMGQTEFEKTRGRPRRKDGR